MTSSPYDPEVAAAGGSEQQEGLELDHDPEPDGLDSPAWERDDPDTPSVSREPIQLEPVESDGPPLDTEPDQVARNATDTTDAGSGTAAGPEQEAMHIEEERD